MDFEPQAGKCLQVHGKDEVHTREGQVCYLEISR